jgi:predicted ATPase
MATKEFAATEAAKAYTRALELCQQTRDTPRLFPVQWNLWLFAMMRGELQTARGLGEQLLTLAQNTNNLDLVLQAHHALGPTLSWLGDLALTRAHLEQGIVLYEPQRHSAHAFLYGGHDPGSCCQAILARVLWLLGYPEQALKKFAEALALAQELAHPFSLANTLFLAARVHQFHREGLATQEHAEVLVALCRERGFAQFLASGTILRGWALAEQGREEEGIDQMRQGVAAYQITGAVRGGPHDLALLAETYGKIERSEEGLRTLSEALTLVDTTGERYYEAELYRLYGELTLQQQFKVQSSEFKVPSTQHPTPRTQVEAEACFLKAIAIAQKQQAKSWELRATTSLVRLRQQQTIQDISRTTQYETRNRLIEARDMLAKVYNWFTEGFDTKDLQEAKALLEALRH